MVENFTDLGLPSATVDPGHQLSELFPVRNPARCAAFVQSTKINELNVEPANASRFLKHVGLQCACGVPGRLPAHSRIKRKEQTASGALRARRSERADAFKKRFNLGPGRNWRRRLLGILGHGA